MGDWLYKNGKTELTCSIMLRLCELNIELKFGENLKIWVPKEVVVFGKPCCLWRAEAPRVPCAPLTSLMAFALTFENKAKIHSKTSRSTGFSIPPTDLHIQWKTKFRSSPSSFGSSKSCHLGKRRLLSPLPRQLCWNGPGELTQPFSADHPGNEAIQPRPQDSQATPHHGHGKPDWKALLHEPRWPC